VSATTMAAAFVVLAVLAVCLWALRAKSPTPPTPGGRGYALPRCKCGRWEVAGPDSGVWCRGVMHTLAACTDDRSQWPWSR
jgi:hypothetical protein